jgi:hypothetical protein
MIDTIELKKNNYVYDNHGRIASVFTIGCESVRLSSDSYKAESFNVNDINPIPFTEDILDKCNFNTNNFGYKCFCGGRYVLVPMQNAIGVFLDEIESLPNKMELIKCVSSLHQFQNLHNILSSKELEINL